MSVSSVGKTCPYCQTPIKPDARFVVCPTCRIPHHSECWHANDGCTTYGCPHAAPPPDVPAPAPLTMMPPPPPHPIGMPEQKHFPGMPIPCKEANEALICAIVGLFCLGIVLEPLAIVKALRAKKQIQENPNLDGERKATAALVIAILALVVFIIGAFAQLSALSTP